MKIINIWFTDDYIYGIDETKHEYRQSLLWYPKLRTASEEERTKYTFGLDGIHWRNLDEDVSFESFEYQDADPDDIQRFFLTNRQTNLTEFARPLGIDVALLRSYINGFKKPTPEQQAIIRKRILTYKEIDQS